MKPLTNISLIFLVVAGLFLSVKPDSRIPSIPWRGLTASTEPKQLSPQFLARLTEGLQRFQKTAERVLHNAKKVGLKDAHATVGDNSYYALELEGTFINSILYQGDPTDCGSQVGLANQFICMASDDVDVNGYGTYVASAGGLDYSLRVSVPGGDYRYLAELWTAPTGDTKRRTLTLYRNENGKKYKVYISGYLIGAFNIALACTVDLTDNSNQTTDCTLQILDDSSGNTWAQNDVWRDWASTVVGARYITSANTSTGYFVAKFSHYLDTGAFLVQKKGIHRIGVNYTMGMGVIQVNGGGYGAVGYQCANRFDQDPGADDLYTVMSEGSALSNVNGSHCSFVDNSEDAGLTTLQGTVLEPNQANLELADDPTRFPLTWWNASDAAP